MSVLRPLLSRRGRLVFVATALLLIGALVAAPSISGAAPARVKQFIASISGGAGSSFTVTVTNCGGPTLPPECTLASTIGLGAVQIAIPPGFQPATNVQASSGSTAWTNAGYNAATQSVEVISPGGSNKLNPGQTLLITFNVTATTCQGTNEFTTKAWGANSIAGSEPFDIKSSQPTVSCLGSGGGTVPGPNGQTETVTGDFHGTLIVTFGGNLNCNFGTFGDQWSHFHLPTQVNITPGSDFVAGSNPKISTSRFPAGTADSSSYLICFASLTDFTTRGGPTDPTHVVNIGGTNFFVGILPNCYNPTTEPPSINEEPCVSEQFLDLTTSKIVISVRMPPEDPLKH
jgi:hypothetical protein